MKRRTIISSIAFDEKFNAMDETAQLIYLKLLPQLDDYGRIEAGIELLRARIEPLMNRATDKYEQAIKNICSAHLAFIYRAGDKLILQVNPTAFDRINKYLIKHRTSSNFPAYDKKNKTHSVVAGVPFIISKQKTKCTAITASIQPPESLRALDGFMQAWGEWEQFRRELRKPLTPMSQLKQLKMLSTQPNPIAVIEQSIRNGWIGLFPIKGETTHERTQANRKIDRADIVQSAERARRIISGN